MESEPGPAPLDKRDPLAWAIELATAAARAGGGPFGAVIVRNGQVLATGTNRVVADCDPTAHAEIVAIRAATAALGSHVLDGATLYSSCEPCPMCAAAIHWARIARVEYAGDRKDAAQAGFDDAVLYRELRLEPPERTVPATRRLAECGREPFEAWDTNPGRTPY